jgi:sugar/nucleoside kinase (ribokinase family)
VLICVNNLFYFVLFCFAGFIYAFLGGKKARDCLKFANACAALHIGKKRSRNIFPTLKELTKQTKKQGNEIR